MENNIEKMIGLLKENSRDSVRIKIGGKPTGRSHFGGVPELPIVKKFFREVPMDYPTFKCSSFEDDEVKERPLNFLMQIDCAEIADFDKSGLLPKTGTLLFFYQYESNCWGFDPKDKGSFRVIYYDGKGEKTAPTEDITVYPEIGIKFTAEKSYPGFDNLTGLTGNDALDVEAYEKARAELGAEEGENAHKLLGWSDPIQGEMEYECELISRGNYLGHGYPENKNYVQDRRKSLDEWLLLFQLDTVSEGDFELMFGDCGRIYFFIRRGDLAEKRFDRVWMIFQCC